MTVDEQTERTPLTTDEEQEPDSVVATPGREPRPWIVVGLVFLALFVAIVIWLVIRPVA
jgi:hypothetical protein